MAGASVAAKTNKTTTVHLSSASVETEAACHAALDIVGIRHLLEEIGIWYNKPVVIYEDNQPTIQVANNERSLADAGRHLETRNYKLSELVENESDPHIYEHRAPSSGSTNEIVSEDSF